MRYHLSYSGNKLSGTVTLPVSKSISSRLLIINAIGNLGLDMTSISMAKDTQTLNELLSVNADEYNVLDGGTTARFFTAYLAATNRSAIVTGTKQMQKRPINGLVDALTQLGGKFTYLNAKGSLPLKTHGAQLTGGKVKIRGDISSQFISAILLIAPALKNGLTVDIDGEIVSKPYIDMTLSMMGHYGITCYWKGSHIIVPPGNYVKNKSLLEPDWSAASYWYAMAALSTDADIILNGLTKESLQGDSVVASIYSKIGVETKFIKEGVRLKKSTIRIGSLACNFTDCPDLAQTVIITCAAMGITGTFSGLKTLKIKETHRIAALRQELKKIKATLEELPGGTAKLSPSNGMVMPPAAFLTYNDHRMALALSVLCVKWNHVIIDNPLVVEKSYPGFWEGMKRAGVSVNSI